MRAFYTQAEMITACVGDRNDAGARAQAAPWQLIKLGPGAAGEVAPTEAHSWGSRQLLGWAKSKEAQQAGLGLDQQALEQFVRRVVTLFTEGYAQRTLKGGKLTEGGRVSRPLPQRGGTPRVGLAAPGGRGRGRSTQPRGCGGRATARLRRVRHGRALAPPHRRASRHSGRVRCSAPSTRASRTRSTSSTFRSAT